MCFVLFKTMTKKPIISFRLHSPNGRRPSSRLRGLLPLAVLKQYGIPAELYQDCNRDQYKIVVFQKLYDTREQQLAKQLKRQGATIVLDLCDNIFFNPLHDAICTRKIQELRKMISITNIITVSTPELAKCFPNIAVRYIRDGVEEIASGNTPSWSLNDTKWLHREQTFRELVWFGTAESACGHRLMLQLLALGDLLNDVQRDYKLRLSVISNNKQLYRKYIRKLPIPTRYFHWNNRHKAHRILQNHEICLLPIHVDPFTRCKTHNRLSLALNAGLGVVASSIPSYEQFSSYCFLNNWEEGIRTYLSNPTLRQKHVREGQHYISNHFTIKHAAFDWWQLFSSLLPKQIAPLPSA